mgnify:CR=1 FL=1
MSSAQLWCLLQTPSLQRILTNFLAPKFTLAAFVQMILLLVPFLVALLSRCLLREPIQPFTCLFSPLSVGLGGHTLRLVLSCHVGTLTKFPFCSILVVFPFSVAVWTAVACTCGAFLMLSPNIFTVGLSNLSSSDILGLSLSLLSTIMLAVYMVGGLTVHYHPLSFSLFSQLEGPALPLVVTLFSPPTSHGVSLPGNGATVVFHSGLNHVRLPNSGLLCYGVAWLGSSARECIQDP